MSESPVAPRLATALADRYRIERELGAGGMATVYLAEDLKHQRKVALKVLRPELAAALGPERFLREIATTASLRHPHILPLFDSGDAQGFLFYVMPFVEGESLRDRLDRETQLPLDDALRIASEVADALSYAHSRGVIHRDIKPENILLETGHAVVADFGIARAVRAAGGDRLTETGLAVGTPAYMSPEQAAGSDEIDGRSDLYALGCVLYEMLAGQPPFTGPTVESLVHQHLAVEAPSITNIRPAVPASLAGVLQRSLAKNPADRFNPVAQFSEALSSARRVPALAATPRRGRIIAVAAVAAVLVVGAVIVVAIVTRGEPTVVVSRTVQVTRDPGLEVDPALSPDGALVAYAAGPTTHMQIFVRQVSGGRVIALTSDTTKNHRWPRWSPDGSRVAYQAGDGIEVVPALGGQPQSIIRLEAQDESFTSGFFRLSGLAWSPDGHRIAYARGADAGTLTIVSLDGEAPIELNELSDEDSLAGAGFHSPSWSPDGSRLAAVSDNPIFIFGGAYFGNEGASSIWILPANGDRPVRVTDDTHLNMSPQWGPDGRYLYWVSDRGGGRDVYRVRVGRDGRPAGEPLRITTGADAHTITLSPDGTRLAYASFRTHSNIWSLSVPRQGVVSGDAARGVTTGAQTIEAVDVTGDGRWLAFDSDQSGNSEIYTMPSAGGEPRQLTTNPAGDYNPAWSPDGSRIAFHSLREGTRDIFTMAADGSGLTRRTEDPTHELDVDWSPDGDALAYEVLQWDVDLVHLAILPLAGGGVTVLDAVGDFVKWSPAGDLLAFHGLDGLRIISPEGGASRLLVPITEEGGEPFFVAWAPDGRTLYYLAKSARDASIHAIAPAGGRARLLVRFDDPSRQPTRYGFATDGRTFYLTMGSHESDVWVADLERRR